MDNEVIDNEDIQNSQETQALHLLDELSEGLLALSPEDFVQALPDKVCEVLSVSGCIIWKVDRARETLKFEAASQRVDQAYGLDHPPLNHPTISRLLSSNNGFYISDINADPLFEQVSTKKNWVSLLSYVIKDKTKQLGLLLVFTETLREFTQLEQNLLRTLANYAALSFQRYQSQQLIDYLREMTTVSNIDELWQLLLTTTKTLSNTNYIWIGRWDYLTGNLINIDKNIKDKLRSKPIKFGQGITGLTLEKEETILVNNVKDLQWKDIYIEHWPDTRSELSIPIRIEKVPIREGIDVKLGSKIIGVLNIESPQINAFSEYDQHLFDLLARYAAILLDKLDFEKKLNNIRKIERDIIQAEHHDQILKKLGEGILDTLGFNWVNISMINFERNEIKSEYVQAKYLQGSNKKSLDRFKSEVVHSLESDDIQADIVKTGNTEVPSFNDPRFDETIFKNYDHETLIRVFIPIIEASSDQVIGTVEAGYLREYRKYIYEQDIQLLKILVEKTMDALERIKAGWIDKITHELKAPIVTIRNNADFLQYRLNELNNDKIRIKLNDILVDCDLLLYQVNQIEYFVGQQDAQAPKREQTIVFRDVIIKTILPLIDGLRLSRSSIEYKKEDINRIVVNTDKAMLNQVVYNLLLNAIKYAEKPSEKTLKIVLDVEEQKDYFIVKFKDWGIGVNPKYADKIFLQRFRTPEAQAKDVKGSGLGLSISRKIMYQLGGDLKLVNCSKPTEFHLFIPKNS